MIEFKRIEEQPDIRTNFDLYINGKKRSYSEYNGHQRDDEESSYSLTLRSKNIIEQFLSHKLKELPKTAEHIFFSFRPYYGFGLDFLDSLYINENYERKYNKPGSKPEYEYLPIEKYHVSYSFTPDLTEWTKTYSFTEYFDCYVSEFENIGNQHLVKMGMINGDEGLQHGFFVHFDDIPFDIALSEILESHLITLRQIHSNVESKIFANQNQNSVSISIEIPDEIRGPYSQYLA